MRKSPTSQLAFGFIAGALGVLIFHQGFIWILHLAGIIPIAPYSLQPTEPLQVPQVLSLAFWGGLWGIVLVLCLERLPRANRLLVAFLFGGIFPPLIGMLVVAPLKGKPVDWSDWHLLVLGFLINGVWGLGTALSYRALRLADR